MEVYPPVDLIRASAIVLVIVVHAILSFPTNYLQTPGSWWVANVYDSLARPCVPLFVMVSGALLLTPSKVDEPLRIFFQKRLKRIALPFLFWGMAYFAWRRFANHNVVTFQTIWQGFAGVSGQLPYYHFWFIYMLIGLYLVTPILRVLVAHAGSKILSYFVLLWFLGAAIALLLGTSTSLLLNSDLFIIPGYVGYFVLGAYLRTVRLRSWILYALLILGFLLTVFGNWFVSSSASVTGYIDTIFTDYLSASVILASGALFLLLCNVRTDRLESRFPRLNWLLRQVALCSFAIYLFHPMVLEVLGEKGLFGFNLGIINLNPILGIPLLSLVTLIVSFGIVWLLRKVPILNKAIG